MGNGYWSVCHRTTVRLLLHYSAYFTGWIYDIMLPLIRLSEISHTFVLYSATKIRSSASKRLCWASLISMPGRLPSR